MTVPESELTWIAPSYKYSMLIFESIISFCIQMQLQVICQDSQDLCARMEEKFGLLLLGCNYSAMPYAAPTEFSGGRPRFVITRSQVERLLTLGFTKKRISQLLGVNRITLWRRMKEFDFDRTYSIISDEEINGIARTYRREHPYTGLI